METLKTALSNITVGDPIAVHNLIMFPLRGTNVADPGYITLDKAMEQHGVTVTEVGCGTVPELLVTNSLEVPVFVLDGEELVGAKQNRVVNLSILVPAKTELKVPVTCIEAGRWRFESREFRAAARTHHPKSRARRSREVSFHMAQSLGVMRMADQRMAWMDVDEKLERLGVDAPTRSLSDAFERHAVSLSEYVDRLQPQEGQTGACFAINGRLVGMDLFDSVTTFAAEQPKLAQSYALDAIETLQEAPVRLHTPGVLEFHETLSTAPVQSFKAIGEGNDLRIHTPTLSGGGLEAWGRLIHLCAFPMEGESERRSIGM